MILSIDPGESAGFAVLSEGRIVACSQRKPAPKKRAEIWGAHLRELFVRFSISRVGIEAPCYAANEGRRQGVSAALGERVGELRGLCWGFGVPVESVPWKVWQAWAFDGIHGIDSEDKALKRCDRMGVPRAWLMGPKGGILHDAASACCVAGAMWAAAAEKTAT